MADLPNCGVDFTLGYYKVEFTALTPYGRNRNFIIENDKGVYGLYHSKLFEHLRSDIDILEKTINEFVEKSRVQNEKEMEQWQNARKTNHKRNDG